MNTSNNSNTKKWCPDCENQTSNSQCSGYNNGTYLLPCKILRKIANHSQKAYNKISRKYDVMPCDFEEELNNITSAKYYEKQSIKKELIISSMLFTCYHSYSPDYSDNELSDILFEYSGFSVAQISIINKLAYQIQDFEIKIRDEWFANDKNEQAYLSAVKNILNK